MTTQITLMKFVKPQIDEFKKLIGSGFVERYLNKVDATGFYDEWNDVQYQNAGIKSDFIRLLRAKIKGGNAYSIGFAFNYIDKSMENSTIKMSIKVGDTAAKSDVYLSGQELPVLEFKEKLKAVNKLLSEASASLDYKIILESLINEFCQGDRHHLKHIDLSSQALKKRVYSEESSSEL